MEGQHGFIPPTESKTEDPRQSGYQQTGFQPTDTSKTPSFNNEDFHVVNQEGSEDLQQAGLQPTHPLASPTFNLSGFQPANTGYQPLAAQQRTTINAEKFSEIEQAAKAALEKVSSLISDIAFTPQPSGGFD